jgi:hypothetical protein
MRLTFITIFLLVISAVKAQDTIPAHLDLKVWSQYMQRKLTYHLDTLTGVPAGVYKVKLKIPINADGIIGVPKIVSDPGYSFGAVAVKIVLRYTGKWYPATVKDIPIDYELTQDIIFHYSDE